MSEDDDYVAWEQADRDAKREVARRRHLGNLEVVDVLLALEAEASPALWAAVRVPAGAGQDLAELHRATAEADRGLYMVSPGMWDGPDVALVVALRNAAKDVLQARRRLLERHGPAVEHLGPYVECRHCVDAQENAYDFPCPDYVDLEAGLVMPHRATVRVDEDGQFALAECVCGWSRSVSYARKLTDGPVNVRAASVWASRHLAGEPDAQLAVPDHAHTRRVPCPRRGCRYPAPGWDDPVT